MLAVLLALTSAAGYGASDFAAGLAARRASVLMVTFIATVCSLVLTVAVLQVISRPGTVQITPQAEFSLGIASWYH